MRFIRVPVPNSDKFQLYANDSLAGIQAIITNCADNSGFIGRVADAMTGETLREFYGSSEVLVKVRIDNFINSLVTKGFIASL